MLLGGLIGDLALTVILIVLIVMWIGGRHEPR